MAREGEVAAPPQGGIEVDLRLYISGLVAIMACSFMAGLQQSPLVLMGLENRTDLSGSESDATMPPLTTDRSKIVRDAFLTTSSSSSSDSGVDTNDDSSESTLSFDPTAAAAGEHLLVDIEGVDADFLDSESRLAAAMVETAQAAGLELLSYHCHSLEPKGVSCVGVLLESHMSFHTWPDEGVITLDLYVTTVSTNRHLQQTKQQPLVPNVVEVIKRLFGIRGAGNAPRPLNARWSHEFRGFDPAAANIDGDGDIHLAGSDLALWVLSPLEMHSKTLIHSSWPLAQKQRIDIWDIVEVTDTPSLADMEKHGLKEGDPRLLTPELASPARILFMNGRHVADINEEAVLMETVVHPAMFAHANPQRATIVAGPASVANGLIRELLKHATLSQITAWHTVPELVETIIPQHFGTLDNCTNLIGRAGVCWKDELVDLQYYGDKPVSSVITADSPAEKQDVLYLLDFESFLKSTDDLAGMVADWMNALTEEGVLLLPLGHAAAIHDPRPDLGVYAHREKLFRALEAEDQVAALLVFEEAHGGSLEPESFLLVCKHASCRQRWYARSDQVEYQIYARLVRTNQVVDKAAGEIKKPVLQYFDGTTQRSYQWPKKGWETVYCLREPTPWECAYRHLNQYAEFHEIDVEDPTQGSFRIEARYDSDADETISEDEEELEETRLFATKFIPKGSYIMAEHLASSLMLTSRNLEGLANNTLLAAAGATADNNNKDNKKTSSSRAAIIEDLLEFFDEHGHESLMPGSEQHYVEVGGTALMRKTDDAEQANVEPWLPRRRTPLPKYSPVYERHRMSFDVFVVASRDIAVGDEVVMHQDMWTLPTVD